ncbi:hypothetical protein AMATHDRAFT_142224 [Amanita thiersii Skay4041]|uniref:Mss4-like protein n=1 Tax=Amanita thiersii Skay4041 TaxID=703135 RepID=A0A2A9NTN6_9AGAR|nr:hypothetical protein AMATHDRAFT_142224 [Amanita thiersii Skay4041]
MDLTNHDETQGQDLHGQLGASLWDALKAAPRSRPLSRKLSTFAGGITEVTVIDDQQPGRSVNKYDLLCPRSECGSIILKSGVGAWVERESVQLEPADSPRHPLLPALPDPPQTTNWWLVTPSPMSFENIGFTHAVTSMGNTTEQMKLLACAECEVGPLGWCMVGGTEFWVACERVAYHL